MGEALGPKADNHVNTELATVQSFQIEEKEWKEQLGWLMWVLHYVEWEVIHFVPIITRRHYFLFIHFLKF